MKLQTFFLALAFFLGGADAPARTLTGSAQSLHSLTAVEAKALLTDRTIQPTLTFTTAYTPAAPSNYYRLIIYLATDGSAEAKWLLLKPKKKPVTVTSTGYWEIHPDGLVCIALHKDPRKIEKECGYWYNTHSAYLNISRHGTLTGLIPAVAITSGKHLNLILQGLQQTTSAN